MSLFYQYMLARRGLGVAIVLFGLVPACASNNDRGRVLFAEGRYIEAAEVFEHSEAQLAEREGAEHAHYGLYRGMTLLRLGDLDGAAKWLHFARTAEARTPHSLGLRESTALKQAWELLDRARAQQTQSPDPLQGALARSNHSNAPSGPDVAASKEIQNDKLTRVPATGANTPNR